MTNVLKQIVFRTQKIMRPDSLKIMLDSPVFKNSQPYKKTPVIRVPVSTGTEKMEKNN